MNEHNSARLTRRSMLLGLAVLPGLAAMTPRVALAATPESEAIAIAFDGTALVLAADGLWRSLDGGASWDALPSDIGSRVTALAAHPDRPGRILAALAAGGPAVSNDGGATWAIIGSDLPEAPGLAIAAAATQPDTVYLSVAGDGIWQSKDGGVTWAFAMDRPWLAEAEHDLLALASVNRPSGMGGVWIYAGTEAGLTRVPDCFCRWQDVQAGDAMEALVAGEEPAPERPLPVGESIRSLTLAPNTPETLFAATTSGIWKSADAGVSWSPVSEAAAQALAVNPADPNHVVAATNNGILSSHDGGLTWAKPGA